jgi:gentisate 1,2-dioxygenase
MDKLERDKYREDIAGRANVEDTPELVAYYEALEKKDMGALWTVANKIEPWHPQPTSVPVIWRWADVRPAILRAPDLVTPEKAGRRVIMLVNPGRRDVSAAVGHLYTGIQIMKAGEAASAHRHQASALRFIMEGSGAYTVVDGERMTLDAGDFVLTPNGTWHEHGVDASGSTCIWQDGLDIPLMNALDAGFYEVHPDLRQAETETTDISQRLYGAGFVQPAWLRRDWNKPYSPMMKFPWVETYAALRRAAEVSDGSPYDGIIMEYVNPLTGGPVMPTTGATMQLLKPGMHTRAHRHTGSFVYQVAKGQGFSIIDGVRYDWQERDIFVVPSWSVHEHANASSKDDACLFTFNDLPVMRALGLYREAAITDNGGHQTISSRA